MTLTKDDQIRVASCIEAVLILSKRVDASEQYHLRLLLNLFREAESVQLNGIAHDADPT